MLSQLCSTSSQLKICHYNVPDIFMDQRLAWDCNTMVSLSQLQTATCHGVLGSTDPQVHQANKQVPRRAHRSSNPHGRGYSSIWKKAKKCVNIMVHTTALFGGAHEWHSRTAGNNICLKQQLFYTCFLTPQPTRKLHSLVHIFCTVATSIFNISGECIQQYPEEACQDTSSQYIMDAATYHQGLEPMYRLEPTLVQLQ